MYIYNITINVADSAQQEWLVWMKDIHIPQVMKTGCFVDSTLLKVLYVEDEGHTYSIQYKFLEMGDFEKYQAEFAQLLQAEHKAMFADKYVTFRTVLQIIT